MADKQIVNSAEIDACSQRYLSALSTLEECVGKYEKSLKDLANDYTGTAFAIMSGKVTKMGLDLKKSFDKLRDAVSELNEVKDIYEENESTVSSSATALDTGTASPFQE